LIRIKIDIPTKLTPQQRELLNAFGEESGLNTDNQGEGLFDKVKNLFD
jgi:molecular chaperone DnaJ